MRFAPLMVSLLLLVACGGDDGLTTRGQVDIDADGTPTGFQFLETTRLVDLGRDELPGGVMAGECRIVTEEGGVTLVLQAPGEPPEGLGLHRFEIDLPDESEGSVRAQLGTDTYEATVGATCAADLLYRDADDGTVGAEVGCTLEGPDATTATATAELHFTGCSVY